MARLLTVLLLVTLVSAIAWVATTKGFPSTHRAVTGFFHEDLGMSWRATTTATNVVRKAFHVPAYAFVAILVWWVLPRAIRRPWVVLVVVLGIAMADEWIQHRNPTRGGSPWDVLLDLAGASLGLWIVTRWSRRSASRSTNSLTTR